MILSLEAIRGRQNSAYSPSRVAIQNMPRLGISSYTFVWAAGVPGYPPPPSPLTALDLLDKAVKLGVRVVQIADNLPLDQLPETELKSLLDRAQDLNLEIELGTRGIQAEHLRCQLQLATRFGARLLRVVTDTRTHRPLPGEVVAALAPLATEFERAGVTLAIENHDRFKAATLREIVTRIGSRHVGICFDTANSFGCLEGPEQVLETLGRHIVNFHLKDICVCRPPHHKGFIMEGRPAGQGQLDVPDLLKRLERFGVHPNVILELWPPPQASVSAAIEVEDK